MSLLQLIPSPSPLKPWEQWPDETEIEHACFLHWMHEPVGSRSDISGIEAARKFRWGERALAFDRFQKSVGKPRDQIARLFQSLLRLVLIEADALLARVQQAPPGTNILTPKEIATLTELCMQYREILLSGIDSAADVDLSRASVEDLRALQEAKTILKKYSRLRVA